MKKMSIRNRILISFLLILLPVLILTFLVFNIAVRNYADSSSKKMLTDSVATITAIIEKQKLSLKDAPSDAQAQAYLTEMKTYLRAYRLTQNIEILLLDKNLHLLYPTANLDFIDLNEVRTSILPELAGRPAELESGKVMKVTAPSGQYFAAAVFLDKQTVTAMNYIVFLTNRNTTAGMLRPFNFILLLILCSAALIAAAAAVIVSRGVSKPVGRLREYASTIGKRDFKPMPFDDCAPELQELAGSMNAMAARLSEHDESQRTFLQNASHEFRTPLMSIRGYAEGIKLNVFENNGQAADIILKESIRLTKLVEELMLATRLDTFEQPVNIGRIRFDELVAECVERMNGAAIAENKRIELKIPDHAVYVKADEDLLMGTVTNVLTNCIRYARETIGVDLGSGGTEAVLTIGDDGEGFSGEDLEHLFKRFYKGKKGKLGLGLSIAKSSVEYFGGEITAFNSGHGAEFRITIPLDRQ
jgi:two-component system sensor histidine kinase CssS